MKHVFSGPRKVENFGSHGWLEKCGGFSVFYSFFRENCSTYHPSFQGVIIQVSGGYHSSFGGLSCKFRGVIIKVSGGLSSKFPGGFGNFVRFLLITFQNVPRENISNTCIKKVRCTKYSTLQKNTTLPEINSSPLKIGLPNRVFQ